MRLYGDCCLFTLWYDSTLLESQSHGCLWVRMASEACIIHVCSLPAALEGYTPLCLGAGAGLPPGGAVTSMERRSASWGRYKRRACLTKMNTQAGDIL